MMNERKLQISEKERNEIIRYGMKRGKIILVSTIITIILGWILGIVWQSIIFWFSFGKLRKYAGGYHADTEKRCYAISFVIVLTSLLCIRLISNSGIWGIILQTICALIILSVSPVENENHILDREEKRQYRFRNSITVGVLYLMYILLYIADKPVFVVPIGMANLVVAVSLIFGIKKNNYGN